MKVAVADSEVTALTLLRTTPSPLTSTFGESMPVPVNTTSTLVPCAPLVGWMLVNVGNGGITVNMAEHAPLVPAEVVTSKDHTMPGVAFFAMLRVAMADVELIMATLLTVMPLPPRGVTTIAGVKRAPVMVIGTIVPCTPIGGLTFSTSGLGATARAALLIGG